MNFPYIETHVNLIIDYHIVYATLTASAGGRERRPRLGPRRLAGGSPHAAGRCRGDRLTATRARNARL